MSNISKRSLKFTPSEMDSDMCVMNLNKISVKNYELGFSVEKFAEISLTRQTDKLRSVAACPEEERES